MVAFITNFLLLRLSLFRLEQSNHICGEGISLYGKKEKGGGVEGKLPVPHLYCPHPSLPANLFFHVHLVVEGAASSGRRELSFSEVDGALFSLVRMTPIGRVFPIVFELNFDPSVISGVCPYVLTGYRVGFAGDVIV